MEIERRIFRNTFVMTIGQGVAQLVNFSFVVYFARVFGAGTLGDYSFAMAIGALSSIFISLGAHSLALKNISQDLNVEKKLVGSLIPFEVLTGVFIFTGAFIFCELLPMSNRLQGMILIIVAYNVIVKWTGLFCTRFQAREEMSFVAYSDIVRQILRVVFGFILIWKLNDPVAAISVFPICALFVLIWLIHVSIQKYGPLIINFSLNVAKELVINSWPYFSLIIISILYDRLGIILLTFMHSKLEVGYFTSAERLVVAAGVLHAMFVSAIFPAMTRLAVHDKQAMSVLAVRCLRLLLMFTIPAATLLFIFSKEIITILFGGDYIKSIVVLQIVSWALVFRGLNSYLIMLAIAEDYQSNLSKVKFIALLLFVTTALPLVYLMSHMGLAYSILISEVFLSIILCFMLKNTSYFLGLLSTMWKPIIVSIILILVGTIFSQQYFIVRLFILFLTLLVGMIALGAIRYHDLVFLNNILFGSNTNSK